MVMYLEDVGETTATSGAGIEAVDSVDYQLLILQHKFIIRKMKMALDKALLLRGLCAAINDRDALAGKKLQYRERFEAIENEIKGALATVREFNEKK